MAEDDAHRSKGKFERRMSELETWLQPSSTRLVGRPQTFRRKYFIKNAANLICFRRFAEIMDSRDLSYIRRNRYLDILLFLFAHTDKELSRCTQQDIDAVVAASHRAYRTRGSKETFLTMLGVILKGLAPGRFKVEKRLDKSIEADVDRVSFEDICRMIRHLRDDHLFRAYLTTILEAYARPQELVWRTIKDVEVFRTDGIPRYAKIRVSSHGKKGTKTIVIKDTLSYFLEWFTRHPHLDDPDAYLFPNMQDRKSLLRPSNVTSKLKKLQKTLGIKGRLCAYEIKSRGITFACLRGDAPKLVQARAGWANMDPLPHYDKTTADELLDADLAREGLLKEREVVEPIIRPKDCPCSAVVGFAELDCQVFGRRNEVGIIRRPTGAGEVASPPPSVGFEAQGDELLMAIAEMLKAEKPRERLARLIASG